MMKGNHGPVNAAAQQILIDYGIPLLGTKPELRAAEDLSNMAMAINGHLGIHSDRYSQAVLDNLNAAVAAGNSFEQKQQNIKNALADMRTILESGESFW